LRDPIAFWMLLGDLGYFGLGLQLVDLHIRPIAVYQRLYTSCGWTTGETAEGKRGREVENEKRKEGHTPSQATIKNSSD